jgi:hypothetical protein
MATATFLDEITLLLPLGISPGANCGLVAFVGFQMSDTTGNDPMAGATLDCDDPDIVFQLVGFSSTNTNFDACVACYVAQVGADPGTIDVEFNAGSGSMAARGMVVYKITDVDLDGTWFGPCTALNSNATAGDGPQTLVMSDTPRSQDITLAFSWADMDSPGGATFNASSSGTWTEDHDFTGGNQSFGGGNAGQRTGYSADADVDWSDVNTGGGDYGSAQIALIIRDAAPPLGASIRTDATDVNPSGGDIVLAEPDLLAGGDLLVATLFNHHATLTPTAPGLISGFTSAATSSTDPFRTAIQYRVADGSEGPTYTSALAGNTSYSVGKMLRVIGAHPTLPVANASTSRGSGTTATLPSLTADVDRTLAIGWIVTANPLTIEDVPSGWSLWGIFDHDAGAWFETIVYRYVDAGAASGAGSITTLSGEWATGTILIRPNLPFIVSDTETIESTSSNPLTVSEPASLAVGELLLATANIGAGTAPGTITGFTSLGTILASDLGNDLSARDMWRVATGSEGPTYDVTVLDSLYATAKMLRIAGADPTNPIMGWGSSVIDPEGTSGNLPVVAATGPCLAVALVCTGAGITAHPSGWDLYETWDTTQAVYVKQVAAAGNVGGESISTNNWISTMSVTLIRPANPTEVFDDFNRANGGLGANWSTFGGATTMPQIVSNAVVAGQDVPDVAAYWAADDFEDDQYAEADFTMSGSSAKLLMLSLRYTTDWAGGYDFEWHSDSGGRYRITDWPSGDILDEVTGVGDTGTRHIRAEAVGTELVMYVDDAEVCRATDATHTGGVIGIQVYRFDAGATASLDNFAAGPVVAVDQGLTPETGPNSPRLAPIRSSLRLR